MHHLFSIQSILIHYGYLGVFLIVFLESGLIFFLPGDSLLFTAGIFAAAGTLNIFFLIPLIFVSTFLGGLLGYHIGYHLDRFRSYSFFNQLLSKKYIDRAHNFFEKYGRSAVVFSRFVPIVRTFVPVVAGVAKMNYVLFLRYSLVSSLLWSSIVTFAGYFLGNTFPWIKHYMTPVILLVVFLSILPPLFEVIRNKRKH